MNAHLKTLAVAAIALGGVNIAYSGDCIPRQGFDPAYCAVQGTPGTNPSTGNASIAHSGGCVARHGFDPVYCAGAAGESGELALGASSGGANQRDWSDPLGYHRK